MGFNPQDQFNITSPNLAIAFGPQRVSQINHQGLLSGSYPMYTTSTHLTSAYLNSRSITDLNAPVDRSLRLAWLHISES